MARWIPCELHTHTFHSDGKHSLSEVSKGARELGFECIALTDHNTMTGLHYKESVELENGVSVIKGMEWTTFFGHMVTLGVESYVDWRAVGPGDIHKGIEQVHAQGAIAGIAHPYRMGSPVCTGCYWEFEITNWSDIDYIEVWSGTFASIKKDNTRAFSLWTDLLNQGHQISATSGRDWHVLDQIDEPISVTYLGIQDSDSTTIQQQAVKALCHGAISITMGPLLECEIEINKKRYTLGDQVLIDDPSQKMTVQVILDMETRKEQWELPDQDFHVILMSNLGIVEELVIPSGSTSTSVQLPIKDLRWVRAELEGTIQGVNTLIAFTNPIYFQGISEDIGYEGET